MKVIVNAPAPVPTPPTTYNLIGLTGEEMYMIRIALMNHRQKGGTYSTEFSDELHDLISDGMEGR